MRKNKKVLNIIAALLVVLVLLCMMTRSEGFIIINSKLINPKHDAWEAGQAIRDAEWAKERAAGQKIIDAKHAAQKQETERRRLAINAQNDAKWAKERAAGQKIIDARNAALEKESIANRLALKKKDDARAAALKKEFEARDLAIKAKDAQLERENKARIALHNDAITYARSVIKGKPHRWSKAEDQEEVKAYHDYIAQHSKF
jgi:choline dehydrogenase-like flavoprotein